MTRNKQGVIIYYIGMIVSVLAPLITAMTQFPVWTEKVPKSQLGSMFVFTALLSCIPFLKHIKMQLKTPSAVTVWTLLFVICWAMNKIITQLYLIALVGMVANIVGAIMYAVGNHLRRARTRDNQYIEEEKEDE
ncbi:MAG: hypothetical protein K2J89_06970 [Clostridia bacterium]|nr:hypothetical protein [Clostridia bacterium]